MKFWSKGKGLPLSPAPIEVLDQEGEDGQIAADDLRWVGYVDKIGRSLIQGWACDRAHPMASVAVEAIGSGGGHVIAIASIYRRDVEEGGYGSGHHGFELDIGDFADSELVTVQFVENRWPITTAPIALDPIEALQIEEFPDDFLRAMRGLARATEVRFLALQTSWVGIHECMLETFDAASDPEGMITRFTAHEATRIVRNAFDLEMRGSLQERLSVLLWYIDDYASGCPISTRVPLSSGQIAALNSPARIAGASEAVTVTLHNFVLRHRPGLADLREDRLSLEAVYWWCVEQAPLLRLEDRLVTAAQARVLAAVEFGAGTDFPCTIFMSMYAKRQPNLRWLDLGVPADRLALLAVLVLESFTKPGLLRFLPREAIRRLMREDSTGSLVLDRILGRLAAVGEHQDRRESGREIRRKGEALLAAAAISLSARRQPVPAVPPAPATPRPGVAVIGPLSKSSGLGRAMRLSIEALAACEDVAPAPYDFGMANPAPGGGNPLSGQAALDAPREITLLHLNAEALPLALAYGPAHLLAGTYRIGFFFWELNEIPECHRLALDLVDEIWVASEFDRKIYARATDKPVIRVGMAAPALPEVAPASRADYDLEPDAFVFVATFDSLSFIARKNPLGTIEAFARAFPRGDEPVRLVLKTQNRGIVDDPWQVRNWRAIDRAVAADARILLLDETLSFADLVALLRACDAYVSLHRAEGWGFGLVEAMQLGLPVICTGGSGNADFCTPDTAYLVDYDLIPVAADEYIYVPRGSVWADPSTASAAAHMRQVVADRAGAAAKTQAARAFVARELSLEATARRYAERLAAIRGSKGGAAG